MNNSERDVSRCLRVTHIEGTIIIADANTTVGYCRYTEEGEVEYIFVGYAFRRQGYAMRMLEMVEARVNRKLCFQPPVSPLGTKLREYYDQRSPMTGGPRDGRSVSGFVVR